MRYALCALRSTVVKNDHSYQNLFWPIFASAGRATVLRLTFFYLPIFLIGSGRTGWETGLLMSLFAVTAFVFALPMGLFNDRMESRRLVQAGFALFAVFFFGAWWRGDFFSQIVFFFCGGLGALLTQLSLESLLLKGAREGVRGKRFGLFQLITVSVFAFATAGGGWLIGVFDFPKIFIASGILSVVFAVLSGRLERAPTEISPISSYRAEMKPKGRKIFVLILFLFAFHWGAEVTSYTPFLRDNLGLSLKWTGLYMGGCLISLALASFLSGRFSDRLVSIRYLMALGFILSGVCQILMIFPPAGLSFAFRVLHEIGDGIIMLLIFFWVSTIFHVDRVSGHYGLVNFALLAGQTVSSIVFGPVGRAWGFAAPLWITGVTTLLCFGLLSRYRHTVFEGV
jgi:MFS family permease